MVYDDPGMGDVTGVSDVGLFKVPTLRNITLTAPYMHDGRFETLEDVEIKFNKDGIGGNGLLSVLKSSEQNAMEKLLLQEHIFREVWTVW